MATQIESQAQTPTIDTLYNDHSVDLAVGKGGSLMGCGTELAELLKLGLQVSKRTIQKYLKQMPRLRPSGQTWSTFVRNHAADIWGCDLVQTYDVFFRTIFVFVIIELESRQIIHVNVARLPSNNWVAQQPREATPFGRQPIYLIRDGDQKYGEHFANVAAEIEVLRTPVRAPHANVYCERFIGSLRRECLHHMLILGEKQLRRIVKEYKCYFNEDRPHQGLHQCIPPHLHLRHRLRV
jgi:putative transposase